ncbi:hypothetical protein BDZ45DRAFT_750695 [Acephala macrosclerotiorum]|nr:hypothetical protein BDZ45DRAFT_750695 [Acephala macrosclerotiorum]
MQDRVHPENFGDSRGKRRDERQFEAQDLAEHQPPHAPYASRPERSDNQPPTLFGNEIKFIFFAGIGCVIAFCLVVCCLLVIFFT